LLKSDFGEAQNNLGTALQKQGRLDEAVASYRQALLLTPEDADAHRNLGNALQHQEKFDEAVASYLTAISLKPNHPETHSNLGTVFHQLGKFEEAVSSYRQALLLKPDYAEAYNNLGSALQNLDRTEEAVACYERALSFKPDFPEAYSNLLCIHASTRDISPEEERRLATKWECTVLSVAERAAARNRKFSRPPRIGRKLRLGIVSAEIGNHAVAEFVEPFLEQVDRNRFEVTLFPTRLNNDFRALRMKAMADDFVPLVGLSDAHAAEAIRSAAIDVLMDTTGHTQNCRLGISAHRAAPVQITYVGYWGTTGLTEMDWIVGDRNFPPHFAEHFSEDIWRLHRSAVCYRGDRSLPNTNWKPDSDGAVWLGSFNRYKKIREATLGLWAKVMNAVPESKLLLEDRAADDSCNHQRIVDTLALYGVAGERIFFEPFVSGHVRHMVLYDRLDIALDTIPFNSGTTGCDALWMGVPLVTIEGDTSAGRIAGGYLQSLGKPEWIAHSEDEYVAIVARLARDVEGRKALRPIQRELMANSELCDSTSLANALQDAFEQMFDVYQGRSCNERARKNNLQEEVKLPGGQTDISFVSREATASADRPGNPAGAATKQEGDLSCH